MVFIGEAGSRGDKGRQSFLSSDAVFSPTNMPFFANVDVSARGLEEVAAEVGEFLVDAVAERCLSAPIGGKCVDMIYSLKWVMPKHEGLRQKAV